MIGIVIGIGMAVDMDMLSALADERPRAVPRPVTVPTPLRAHTLDAPVKSKRVSKQPLSPKDKQVLELYAHPTSSTYGELAKSARRVGTGDKLQATRRAYRLRTSQEAREYVVNFLNEIQFNELDRMDILAKIAKMEGKEVKEVYNSDGALVSRTESTVPTGARIKAIETAERILGTFDARRVEAQAKLTAWTDYRAKLLAGLGGVSPADGQDAATGQDMPDNSTQDIPDNLTQDIPDNLTQDIPDNSTQEPPAKQGTLEV
jgi:hypothetical protein